MSHRKFERPRHGSLSFLPRKRCQRHQGKVKSFPLDDGRKSPHLTSFMGWKAGMTHVVRELDRPGSKLHRKEIVDSATILDCPPMVVVGLVGYTETPSGLKALGCIWAQHLSEECKRRFYKNWFKSKQSAFKKYAEKFNAKKNNIKIEKITKFATIIRAICHSQPKKTPIGSKKANIMEIQVNGGDIKQKISFCESLFETPVSVSSVFETEECVDSISITKGKGVKGVVRRWGVTRLPRKSHRGLRKVACIGAWHPSRVQFEIPRHGQCGYHHRHEKNKRILRIGDERDVKSASTDKDLTEKSITPMGGFPHYGIVKNDFLLIKGSVPGSRKRAITLRKTLTPTIKRNLLAPTNLRFIDTSSKFGHGRFQTSAEKRYFFNRTKAS